MFKKIQLKPFSLLDFIIYKASNVYIYSMPNIFYQRYFQPNYILFQIINLPYCYSQLAFFATCSAFSANLSICWRSDYLSQCIFTSSNLHHSYWKTCVSSATTSSIWRTFYNSNFPWRIMTPIESSFIFHCRTLSLSDEFAIHPTLCWWS